MYKFLIALCLHVSLAASTLTVGTNAEFKPFSFIENDEIVGFDIDVAKQVCKRLNVDMKIKDMPFDALIAEAVLGQVDFVAAGMSYTDERAKRVLFTSCYLSNDPLMIVSYTENLTLNDLAGKKVVVNEGFVADIMLSERKDITLIRLLTAPDGFLAVKNKRSDAFVTAKSTFDAFVASQGDTGLYASAIQGSDQTCALVISKKYPELQKQIQTAIDEMVADGTMDMLKKKWGFA